MTIIEEYEPIKTWSQFVRIASKNRYKQFIYRGHPKKEYELKSSIQRAFERLNVRKDWQKGREGAIIKSFKSRTHLYLHHLPDRDKTLEWLSVMGINAFLLKALLRDKMAHTIRRVLDS